MIANFIQENLAKIKVTQPKYLTRMANAIIDEDTRVSMEYIHLIKIPKHRPVWVKSFANDIGLISQGVDGRVKCIDKFVSAPQEYTWK